MKKIDSNTYEVAPGFFVEKMEDGTWTAYQPMDKDDRYLWQWSSPKHRTMISAQRTVSAHRRFRKHFGK